MYFYRLQDSGATAASPNIISPHNNAGDKRWHLAGVLSTGNITGRVPIVSKSAAYTLGTDSLLEPYGSIVMLTGDATVLTLPAVVAGMSVLVYSADNNTKRVDPNANDGIVIDGARNTDGKYIQLSAGIGNFVSLFADSSAGWSVLGRNGTLTVEE